jgi:hypothetical protein
LELNVLKEPAYDYDAECEEPVPIHVVHDPKVKRRVESLELDFDDYARNCDSPRMRNYLENKLTNNFRSSDNKFY